MYKSLSLVALAGFAAAQSLAGLPSCATECVGNSLPANCNFDPKCICESSSFIEAISCCVSKACSENDQEATLTYARTICNPAGVSNLPLSATCASTASGSASSTASDSESSLTTSASNAASSASESAGSIANSASEAAGSASSSAEAAATSAAGGGAGILEAGMGGVLGAGLLGVAALL